jgi:AcrR family transcriptional regulator
VATKSNEQQRREQILQAAARCFIRSGFHGARMAQIAKEAGMSPGHVYHYFDSKDHITTALIESHSQANLQRLRRYERAGDRVVELLIEGLEESIDRSTDPFWSALMMEIAAEATRNAGIASTIRADDAEMRARVTACLADGVNEKDLDVRLEVMIAIMQGLGIRKILTPELDAKRVAALLRELVEVIFRRPKASG